MEIFSDLKLVVGKVQGELEARDLRMQEYLSQVRHLQSKFESFNLSQIPRSRNTHSDALTTLETSSAQSLSQVILVEDLCKPTEIEGNTVHIHQIRVSRSWMDSIVLFLKEDILLEEKSEANKVRRKAHWFWLSEDRSCIIDLFLDCIYYAYTLKQLNYSWKNYMRGFVEATQGVDLCLAGPSLKTIGGQICRGKHKST